jgi:hypothetical protein
MRHCGHAIRDEAGQRRGSSVEFTSPLAKELPSLDELLKRGRAGKPIRLERTLVVDTAIEVLHSRLAQMRELPLQLRQLITGEHILFTLAPRHNRSILAFSPILRHRDPVVHWLGRAGQK